MRMHTELLGAVGRYEMTIEPIGYRTLLSKYSHVLVIRENGFKVDSDNLLYLSPSEKLGLSDSNGEVSWYRSGACHVPTGGDVCTHEMTFGEWLFRILTHVRHLLLNQAFARFGTVSMP